ncbi:hypothetical protein DRP05_14790 [Archaeoglobales archaeon]|nr:MAG: hypothetical protein DRP05_14790 [Archaeoglobales archaeon]
MRISIEEYQKVRRNLRDLRDLNKFGYPRGMLFTILTQKKVDFVKREYPNVIKRLEDLATYWNANKKIPKWVRLMPVMKVRVLMRSLGFSNSEILKAIRSPENVEDDDLRRLIERAVLTDYIYSPLAVKHQFARGKLGENIIRRWLEDRGIEFKDEREMKKESKKTPDFYFDDPIEFNGKSIRWIESKALFGDFKTHWIYLKKQYSQYLELFGEGFVVYWFGCLENLDSNVLDEGFFRTTMKNALLDMRIYMTNSIDKANKLIENLGVSCIANFTDHDLEIDVVRKFRVDDAMKIAERIIACYERGRVLALFEDLKDYNVKNSRFLLKNMGFDVVVV